MDWLEFLKIFGTIAASAGIAWKLPKYYIDKEAKEPIARLGKEIDFLKGEVDMMKAEMKTIMQTSNETKTVLVELSTKLNYIADSVKELTREVLTLIKND